MRLEVSRFVEADLDDITAYIFQDNPRRAITFIDDIRAKFNDIHRNPLIYRLRIEVGDDARIATVGNYAILFRVLGDVVRIERVTYGGRDLAEVFDPT